MARSKSSSLLVILLLALAPGDARSQLVTTNMVSPAQLVTNILGSGVTASNITYTGTPNSAGTFTGGAGIIGFGSGIVLSSGNIANVIGPNNLTGQGTTLGTPGDANLTALGGNPTFDATVLEFDFVPATSGLTLRYVFTSEEYLEYVGGTVNDVFGFFVNGQNVALLPTTNTASNVVSINNVNNTNNSTYYVDNASGTLNTQMDGLTVVLTVTATVIPFQTNHIKIAIADAGDSIVDSAVFIEAGSFSGNGNPTKPPFPGEGSYGGSSGPTGNFGGSTSLFGGEGGYGFGYGIPLAGNGPTGAPILAAPTAVGSSYLVRNVSARQPQGETCPASDGALVGGAALTTGVLLALGVAVAKLWL